MRKIIRQKGAALVELAIITPLLFTLLFGIISYGIMLYDQAVITNAARTGVRAGIVFAISGNGLQNYTTYPSTCSSLTNTNIYGASATTVVTGAQSTAQCSANNALQSSALISFGSTSAVPSITVSSTGSCTTVPVGPSCSLKITINYAYTGIYGISSSLSTSTSMYYE